MADQVPYPSTGTNQPGLAQSPSAKVGETRESYGGIALTTTEAARLCGFLHDEITRAEMETRPFRESIILWREFVDPRPREKAFPWPHAPLSRDTEICTRAGWCRVDAVRVGDLVLTRQDGSSLLEWAPVEALPRVQAETLIHFRSKSIDQLVTGEHQMVVRTEASQTQRMSAHMAWKATGLRVPLTGQWFGETPDELFGLDAGDVMEFLGWFTAEGWQGEGPDGPNGSIYIGQSKTANPEKCARIEALLNRLEFSWTRLASNEAYMIRARTIPAALLAELRQFGHAHEKRVPPFIFDLNAALIGRYLEGEILGDGHTRAPQAHQNYESTSMTTVSEGLAGDLQILIQLTGKRASVIRQEPGAGGVIRGRPIHGVRPQFTIPVLHKDYAKLDAAKEAAAVPYNDTAFCVTVRNHAIYVRRNGIASWTGNSSVFVPIPRIVLDALKASIKQTITKQKRLFVAEVTSPEHAGIAPDAEFEATQAAVEFAEYVSLDPGHLDLKRVLDEWAEEMLVTGIGPLKVTLDDDSRKVTTRSGTATVTFHRGPRILVVPVGTWIWPAGIWHSVQEMPWVGNWVMLTEAALRVRGAAPWGYKDVEEVIKMGGEQLSSDPDTATRLESQGQMPQVLGHRIYEVYYVCDPYGDGRFYDLVITYSLRANRILRIVLGDGIKPFEVEVASPRPGTVFGRGVIEPIIQPVRAINTAVNQTFDAQTLANAPCLLYPEDGMAAEVLANGFTPGTPVPYKEEKDEIGVLKFPDPSATSFETVAFFKGIIEELTRIGPNRLGEVSEGRRTPATLGLATQQLGAELIDELIDRIRDTIGRVMSRVFVLYYESDRGIFQRVLGLARGTLLETIIGKSVREQRSLSEAIRIRLFASSATRSVELDKQNAVAVSQAAQGWRREIVEYAQLFLQAGALPNGAAAQGLLLDLVRSSEEQMRRLVEMSNQPDAKTIIPEISKRLAALAAPPPAAMPGIPPGAAAGGPPGAAPGGPLQPPPGAPPVSPGLPDLIAAIAAGGGGGAVQ